MQSFKANSLARYLVKFVFFKTVVFFSKELLPVMQIFQACGFVLQPISQENIALWCHKLWLCALEGSPHALSFSPLFFLLFIRCTDSQSC